MLKLYRIFFFFRKDGRSMRPIIASAKNKTEAVHRARAFVASHCRDTIVLERAQEICSTPDNVLDWN